jgi:hypothetical protein
MYLLLLVSSPTNMNALAKNLIGEERVLGNDANIQAWRRSFSLVTLAKISLREN